MGGKTIIRLGDRTSHGGTVVEGFPLLTVHGKPVAGISHQVPCPRCKGKHVIVEGAVTVTMLGTSVAVEGMKTSCGATLIGSAPQQSIASG
jgi:uncharacterized Zn-binding protein involved in type VI secretion